MHFTRWLPPNPTLRDRWGWRLYWLFEGMALDWRRRGLRCVHHAEIGQRVMGLWRRLNSVILRWEAGTLRAAAARAVRGRSSPRPSPQGGEGEERAARKLPAWSVLPRTFGWVRTLLSPQAAGYAQAFQGMLDEPEMRAIIALAPQVGRILRPLCHFLGLETPAELVLPKRVRKRWAPPTLLSEADEAELARLTARFPDTPAARSGKRALRRMFAGLPVKLERMSAVARGYFLHPPRDGNCPPPEIGYGGRVFGPLPKDYVRPKD